MIRYLASGADLVSIFLANDSAIGSVISAICLWAKSRVAPLSGDFWRASVMCSVESEMVGDGEVGRAVLVEGRG